MRSYSLELEVHGWNPESRNQEKVLDKYFSDLLWATSNGISTVFTECETSDPVAACSRIAERLLKSGVAITPVRWHDDFVGYSDLATNVGMSHEAVRLLATGKRGTGDFPRPRGYIGVAANRSPIWTWAEVSPWFNANYEIKDEEHFPDNEQIIEINARLSALRKKYQAKIFATTFSNQNPDITKILESVLTCPNYVAKVELTMPTDACQFFFTCGQCQVTIKPLAGDCCVFCSYGSAVSPSQQT